MRGELSSWRSRHHVGATARQRGARAAAEPLRVLCVLCGPKLLTEPDAAQEPAPTSNAAVARVESRLSSLSNPRTGAFHNLILP